MFRPYERSWRMTCILWYITTFVDDGIQDGAAIQRQSIVNDAF